MIVPCLRKNVVLSSQNAMEKSQKNRKGGPFRLNLHPKAYFDGNPYKSDRRKS